jgi:hypothetical protein
MRTSVYLLAATIIAVAALAPAARAQDMTTATAGGTTVWIGGGFQYLSLPDIKYTVHNGLNSFQQQKNSDFSEYGPSAGAGFETTLGYWNGMRVTGGVKGFYSWLDNTDRKACPGDFNCYGIDPTGQYGAGVQGSFDTKTNREVDYWGGQVEFKIGDAQPVQTKPNLYRNDYFIVGADVRGIDQDNRLVTNAPDFSLGAPLITYNESLNTTYTGGYIGFGGEYSFGFIPGVKNVGGIYDRLGLRTFVNVRAGLYDAQTDYDGSWASPLQPSTTLSKSNDDLAFIGTISLETRKQIGLRTSLSLWTDYEYISSVPQLHYPSEEGQTSRIGDDSAFATRTMLRLNIGFGSAQLYEEPLK